MSELENLVNFRGNFFVTTDLYEKWKQNIGAVGLKNTNSGVIWGVKIVKINMKIISINLERIFVKGFKVTFNFVTKCYMLSFKAIFGIENVARDLKREKFKQINCLGLYHFR